MSIIDHSECQSINWFFETDNLYPTPDDSTSSPPDVHFSAFGATIQFVLWSLVIICIILLIVIYFNMREHFNSALIISGVYVGIVILLEIVSRKYMYYKKLKIIGW